MPNDNRYWLGDSQVSCHRPSSTSERGLKAEERRVLFYWKCHKKTEILTLSGVVRLHLDAFLFGSAVDSGSAIDSVSAVPSGSAVDSGSAMSSVVTMRNELLLRSEGVARVGGRIPLPLCPPFGVLFPVAICEVIYFPLSQSVSPGTS